MQGIYTSICVTLFLTIPTPCFGPFIPTHNVFNVQMGEHVHLSSYSVVSVFFMNHSVSFFSMSEGEVVLHWAEDSNSVSMSLRELASRATGSSEDKKNLEYFRAQLELFSKMCFGRQYLAILKVKEQLPVDVVLM